MNAPFTEKDNPQEAKAYTPGPWKVEQPEDELIKFSPGMARIRGVLGAPPDIMIWANGPEAHPSSDAGFYTRIALVDKAPDAEFIVRACNSHEELLDALEALMRAIGPSEVGSITARARAAIKKVRGS